VIDETCSDVSEVPVGGGHPTYWSQLDLGNNWTAFGQFTSNVQGEQVFGQHRFRQMNATMKRTKRGVRLTAVGPYATGTINLSQSPEGLMRHVSAEGAVMEPELEDYGEMTLNDDLAWTDRGELLVLMAAGKTL